MRFALKHSLFLIPSAALVVFLSYPSWMPDGDTKEALRDTLQQEKGFVLTALGTGYKTVEISFNDPAEDYQHRLLLCADDAPIGCEDNHLQIAGPRAKRRIDRIASGPFSGAEKELTTYMRGAYARSIRPRGIWRTFANVYSFVTKKHL